MANNISERRDRTNSFFITLNTLIVTAVLAISGEGQRVGILILAIVINVVWLKSIATYKQLNSAKFNVINMLEKELPANAFDYEWAELKKMQTDEKYTILTDNEKYVPTTFIVAYIGIIIIMLCIA